MWTQLMTKVTLYATVGKEYFQQRVLAQLDIHLEENEPFLGNNIGK